ncbi:MAG: hypothetical protein FWD11_06155, partial [Micrococcales bacterium]|nr:hypothetical protein [Micrococcales bacterium]
MAPSVATVGAIRRSLEDERPEQVWDDDRRIRAVGDDDDLLATRKRLSATVCRHCWTASKPGPFVLRQVIGDEQVDDIMSTSQSVCRCVVPPRFDYLETQFLEAICDVGNCDTSGHDVDQCIYVGRRPDLRDAGKSGVQLNHEPADEHPRTTRQSLGNLD